MSQQFIINTPGSGTTAPAAATIINSNFTELYNSFTTLLAGSASGQVLYNSAGTIAGSASFTFDGTNVTLGVSSKLNFSTDLPLSRKVGGQLQIGADSATAPGTVYVAAPSVIAGNTDINANFGSLNLSGGQGTGTGVGGAVNIWTAPAGTTGSTRNALVNRVTVPSTGGLTINAPTSGAALNVAQTAGQGAIVVSGAAATQLFGINFQQSGQTQSYFFVPASSNDLHLNVGNGDRFTFSATSGLTISTPASGSFLSFSTDVFLNRHAAATLQFGAADAATAVAQTIGPQSVVAGTTNGAGANFTINGSAGTGTGVGGNVLFNVAPAGTSGTAQNAFVTSLTLYQDKTIGITQGFTVATLPTAGTAGRYARVTDGTAALAWGATVTGGASTPYLVWDNGTAWTVVGK